MATYVLPEKWSEDLKDENGELMSKRYSYHKHGCIPIRCHLLTRVHAWQRVQEAAEGSQGGPGKGREGGELHVSFLPNSSRTSSSSGSSNSSDNRSGGSSSSGGLSSSWFA
jgi:hypothetical protein